MTLTLSNVSATPADTLAAASAAPTLQAGEGALGDFLDVLLQVIAAVHGTDAASGAQDETIDASDGRQARAADGGDIALPSVQPHIVSLLTDMTSAGVATGLSVTGTRSSSASGAAVSRAGCDSMALMALPGGLAGSAVSEAPSASAAGQEAPRIQIGVRDAAAQAPQRTAASGSAEFMSPPVIGERQPATLPATVSPWTVHAPTDAFAGSAEVIKLDAAAPDKWRQSLTEALGNRLQWQIRRGSEHALIRLDPPSLGRVEILVRHEGGNLQVHLSASNSEVLRQLTLIGDGLRQELSSRQHGDVSVVVNESLRDTAGRERSAQQQQQQQRRDEEQRAPYRALNEADAETATPAAFSRVDTAWSDLT